MTAPDTEPVTLTETKTHLRVETEDEDAMITALILAAREHIESWTRRALVTQTWDLRLDGFRTVIWVPKPALQSVTSINYLDQNGDSQLLATSKYQVDSSTEPGRIMPVEGEVWPSTQAVTFNTVTVRFVSGYGNQSEVPQMLKQGLLLLVGHLFENREQTTVQNVRQIPMGIERVLSPYQFIPVP